MFLPIQPIWGASSTILFDSATDVGTDPGESRAMVSPFVGGLLSGVRPSGSLSGSSPRSSMALVALSTHAFWAADRSPPPAEAVSAPDPPELHPAAPSTSEPAAAPTRSRCQGLARAERWEAITDSLPGVGRPVVGAWWVNSSVLVKRSDVSPRCDAQHEKFGSPFIICQPLSLMLRLHHKTPPWEGRPRGMLRALERRPLRSAAMALIEGSANVASCAGSALRPTTSFHHRPVRPPHRGDGRFSSGRHGSQQRWRPRGTRSRRVAGPAPGGPTGDGCGC